MGNEPNVQTAVASTTTPGAPSKTQAIVRRSMDELYNPRPNGLVGNDDLGQMSSWYVWAALGMYPEIPGRAEIAARQPAVLEGRAHPATGQEDHRSTRRRTGSTTCGSLKVNGGAAAKAWLPEAFVSNGGTLDSPARATPTALGQRAGRRAAVVPRRRRSRACRFVDPARAVTPAGSTATAAVGVQDLSGTARPGPTPRRRVDGITLDAGDAAASPCPAGGKATRAGHRHGAGRDWPTAPAGSRSTFSGAGRGQLASGAARCWWPQPDSWLATYNNAGISPDADQAAANFDGGGWSYSADALAGGRGHAGQHGHQ